MKCKKERKKERKGKEARKEARKKARGKTRENIRDITHNACAIYALAVVALARAIVRSAVFDKANKHGLGVVAQFGRQRDHDKHFGLACHGASEMR